MAEYWKSTVSRTHFIHDAVCLTRSQPKYWCKFCEVFVKDVKFERAAHEATGRHQGNVQRSIRKIQKDHDQAEREKQKAKDEIARLSGIAGRSAPPGAGSASIKGAAGQSVGKAPTFTKEPQKQASAEDRKRQLAQLAAMGVAVPEDYRKEVAMIGNWEVVSEQVVGEDGKQPLNIGVRKRKLDEAEEEAVAAGEIITKKKGWGQTYKKFPGSKGNADEDLDALFSMKKPTVKTEPNVKAESPEIKQESPKVEEEAEIKAEEPEIRTEEPEIKTEEAGIKAEEAESNLQNIPSPDEAPNTASEPAEASKPDSDPPKAEAGSAIKAEPESTVSVPKVVFKKRKRPGH